MFRWNRFSLPYLVALIGATGILAFAQEQSSVDAGIAIAQKWARTKPEANELALPFDLRKNTKLYMFFDPRLGPNIAENGFLNQHQTGTSKGTLAPGLRSRLEDIMAGKSSVPAAGSSFESNDLRIRPKYLTVEFPPDSRIGLVVNDAADFLKYGTAIAVFKNDVKDRTTFLFGDSLAVYGPSIKKGEVPESLRLQSFDQPSLLIPRTGAYDYVEGQVWGELRATDVDYLMVFRKRATPEDIAPLKALNRPVYKYDIIDDEEVGYRVLKDALIWEPTAGSQRTLGQCPGSFSKIK